jgi:hypothetical protein
MIYAYQKHIDNVRTVEIALPEGDSHQRLGTELATIDGTTYVYIPDSAALPLQPPEISPQAVVLSDDLATSIKAHSPHIRLINQRIVELIRQRYNIDDEIKMQRLAPSDESKAYNTYVEECRNWGRMEKSKLGV